MKRFRLISLILILALAAAMLAGCGQKGLGSYDGAYVDEPAWSAGDSYSISNGYAASDEGYWGEDRDSWDDATVSEETANAPSGFDDSSAEDVSDGPSLAEKIIYSADAEVETVEFDRTVADVEAMVAAYGGFFEDSYVSGASYSDAYYNNQVLRTASYTIRIPCDRFAEATEGLSRLGQVTSLHRYTENVTARFTDLESRLTALRTEEASLVSMMEQAETVSDLIEIQARLSDVRYEIEYYTSTMRNLQNDVDYSTISLRVQEVKVLTPVVEPQLTYWEQMGAGFMNSLSAVGLFFTNAFLAIGSNLPMILFALILLGVIALLIVRLVRRAAGKNAAYAARGNAQPVPTPPAMQPHEAPVPPAESETERSR